MRVLLTIPLLLSLLGGESFGFLFSVATDKDVYSAGEDVEIELKVENNGDRPLELEFPTSQRYDIVINRNGKEVWRWSYEKVFAMVIGVLKIEPGKTLAFKEVWRQRDNTGNPLGPGIYEIRGILKVKDGKVLDTKTIKVLKGR